MHFWWYGQRSLLCCNLYIFVYFLSHICCSHHIPARKSHNFAQDYCTPKTHHDSNVLMLKITDNNQLLLSMIRQNKNKFSDLWFDIIMLCVVVIQTVIRMCIKNECLKSCNKFILLTINIASGCCLCMPYCLCIMCNKSERWWSMRVVKKQPGIVCGIDAFSKVLPILVHGSLQKVVNATTNAIIEVSHFHDWLIVVNRHFSVLPETALYLKSRAYITRHFLILITWQNTCCCF